MEKIIDEPIERDMKTSYMDYAMSVIVGRALPDVRDGLKPVHRRILYGMYELANFHNKPYKKSARIVGECFVKDTLILTDHGLVPIQDIERGDSVYTQNGISPVSELYEMPEKELLRVTLENGLSNIVTTSQKFKVITKNLALEWKDAKDLTKNDSIVVKAKYPDIKTPISLGKFGDKEIFLDEKIAYLLGQLLSDGWVEKGRQRGYPFRCGFGSSSRATIERIQGVLLSIFDFEASIEERHTKFENSNGQLMVSKFYQLRINSSEINGFLVNVFSLQNAYAHSKIIPPQLFISPRTVIYSFISGLIDGDGSIHKNRRAIHYGSVSEELINGLQILLQHLGIFSAKYSTDKVGEHSKVNGRLIRHNYKFHSLEINSRFANLLASKLSLSEEKKSNRLNSLDEHDLKIASFDEIPNCGKHVFGELSKNHIKSGWYMDKNGNKFRQGIKYPSGSKIRYSKNLKEKHLCRTQIIDWGILDKLKRIDSPIAELLENILKEEVYFLRVRDIKSVAPQKTYDIQVENEHEFVANGMLSHNCLGKYHPHGDVAIYDSLVRMAQNFSLRYVLVDGQGNFGSIDGDRQAAMRYTEVRMKLLSEEMLKDIEKETVDFIPNFDSTLKEPTVLPSRIPNLLINGSSGIAVGMATNIPPNNANEIVDALIGMIDGEEKHAVIAKVKGPDFPTGGIIVGRKGILEAHGTGRGRIRLRSRTEIDEEHNSIIVTEIPYQITKTSIIEKIADSVKEGRITGIRGIHDHSDKEGIRVVIELKRGESAEVVLNQLYKHSPLETTFSIQNLVLVNNEPKLMDLYSLLNEFLEFRKEIVTKRSRFELKEAEERAHILEGLKKALDNIDDIVTLLKKSKDPSEALSSLINAYSLTEIQSKAILDMKLSKLISLEQQKLIDEYNELLKRVKELKEILGDVKRVLALIREELVEIRARYGDNRRTEILDAEEEDIEIEALIPNDEVLVMITSRGYIKRVPLVEYKAQRRGGKGVIGIGTKDQDAIDDVLVTKNHDYLLFFTNKGRVQWLKTFRIPEAGRYSTGKAIVNLLELNDKEEKITAWITVKEFTENEFLTMVTKKGIVKRTSLVSYSRPRKGGIIAINLRENDALESVLKTDGKQSILIASKKGLSIRFNEEDAREIGRTGTGVIGIRMRGDDEVVSAAVCNKPAILTITENGYGKRTKVEEYRIQGRGGHGIINIKTEGRNGNVARTKAVDDNDQVIVVSSKGQVIRIPVSNISIVGRNTMGVRIIKLKENEKVANFAVIRPEFLNNDSEQTNDSTDPEVSASD